MKVLLSLVMVLVGIAGAQTSDTIYYNGKIVTMWANHRTVQALAIRDGRFLAVGSTAEVMKTAGPSTKKIDLAGKCVLPGIIESHVHPISAALSEIDGPLPVMHSLRDIDDYIKTQAVKLPPER
jgi:predicted amidohydrolase YtcJ